MNENNQTIIAAHRSAGKPLVLLNSTMRRQYGWSAISLTIAWCPFDLRAIYAYAWYFTFLNNPSALEGGGGMIRCAVLCFTYSIAALLYWYTRQLSSRPTSVHWTCFLVSDFQEVSRMKTCFAFARIAAEYTCVWRLRWLLWNVVCSRLTQPNSKKLEL